VRRGTRQSHRRFVITNATKAVWIGLLNAGFQFSEAFGLYDFSEAKEKAAIGLFNAAALAYVLVTYKDSPKRISE
jgi:hypothetical protein